MRARRARHAVDDYKQQQAKRSEFAEAAFLVAALLTGNAQVFLKSRRKEISIWDDV